ncbi:MAG: M91 family zinc metallopeptidase, partial [Stackebrandtia sp.]
RRKLVDDLDEIKTECDAVVGHLEDVSGVISDYQGQLDQALSDIKAKLPHSEIGWPLSMIMFRVKDKEEQKMVTDAVAQAKEIRGAFDTAMEPYKTKFDKGKFTTIASRWESIAVNGGDAFDMPPEADGTYVMTVDGRTVVNTGSGDDDVSVKKDPDTGETIVTVNGQEYRYPAGTPITIRGGEGNDTISVPEGTDVDVTMLGGDGDDEVQGRGGNETVVGGSGDDKLRGGDGNDYLSGGSGDDYAEGQGGSDNISGAAGNDTIYGLGDNNTITGGEGDDYVEGGKGDDDIHGGTGNDVLSGGKGDDDIHTGGGNNTVYAGQGDDDIVGGTGDNKAYAESGDDTTGIDNVVRVEIEDPPDWIKIEGSPEFIERMQADLDMYSSSPNGQQMFDGLSDNRDPNGWGGEHSLTIREYYGENGKAYSGDESFWGNKDSSIEINPDFHLDHDGGRPSVVMYHELAHVYSFWNGNFDGSDVPGVPGTAKGEHTAVGLPQDGSTFDSNDPRANVDPDQPWELTENGLREEMGYEYRERY